MGEGEGWGESYEASAARIEVLCGDPSSWAVPVPACPGWVVADVVAHLTGLAQDWVRGRLDDYASAEWTGDQVARFSGRPVPDVIAGWRAARRDLADLDTVPPMGDPQMWAFGDAIVHEADVGGALDAGRPPGDAVRLGTKSGVARWRTHLPEHGISSLRVEVADWRTFWCGEPTDDALMLRVSTWELFRLLHGRRSRSQVADLAWSDDPAQVLDVGLPYPFRWAEDDLFD